MHTVLQKKLNLWMWLCLLPSLATFAQVRIADPARDTYVSGLFQVVLEASLPDQISHTSLFVDGKRVFEADGFIPSVEVDFGEEIVAHEIYASFVDDQGKTLLTSTVRTRALEINVTDTSEVILLTAVVKTSRNNAITGLEQEDFRVLENGRPVEIVSFYKEHMPLDLVFLLDTSSSLRVKGIGTVKAAAASFLEQLDPADRVSLYEFKTKSLKRLDFTNDRKLLLSFIEKIEAIGETALFDTLHDGLGDLKGRRRGRKALVLFTDGRDSVYEEPETKARLMRAAISKAQNQEVSLFTIGLGKRVHNQALERMALETGGRFFKAEGVADLDSIFAEIVQDLKHQYVLGVRPISTERGFQRIKVEVDKRRATVYARKGYTR